ncbi:MAG: hypothetical protein B7X36_06850 [Thiomonas sp. 14-64-326]|nr:MAG: hypothetical protein B7X36_06850 [Thiomonas sp. 14-64-326]
MRKRRAAPSFLIPLGGPDANAAGLGARSNRAHRYDWRPKAHAGPAEAPLSCVASKPCNLIFIDSKS